MGVKIFLDANFLLIPAQLNIDIYNQIKQTVPHPWELIVITPVLQELHAKMKDNPQKSKLKRQIRLSLQILSTIPHRELIMSKPPSQLVDDLLVEVVNQKQIQNPQHEYFIATNDKELRKKCKKYHIRTIFLRKKKWLALDKRNSLKD